MLIAKPDCPGKSQAGPEDAKVGQESYPDSNLLSRQQAHPGMAAAAMAAASNVAGQFLARPSANQTQVVGNSSGNGNSSDPSSSSSSTNDAGTDKASVEQEPLAGDKKLVTRDAGIPWRQIAGLLHGQGITDPIGLVRAAYN